MIPSAHYDRRLLHAKGHPDTVEGLNKGMKLE